jgi:hypothetical protein
VPRPATVVLIVVALALVLSACSTESPAQAAADETFIDCTGDQGFKVGVGHFDARVTGDPPRLVVLSLFAVGNGLRAAAQVCIPEAERAVDRLST